MGNQSELWSAPMTNKTGARGPPPGLSNNNKGNLGGTNAITSTATSSSTNGWIGGNLRLSELQQKVKPSDQQNIFYHITVYSFEFRHFNIQINLVRYFPPSQFRFGFVALNMVAIEKYDGSD